MLTTLLPPTAGTARVAGFDIVKRRAAGALGDRRRPAGGRARPAADRPRAHAPADRAARPRQGRARRARRRTARTGRPHQSRGPQSRRLLGRDEAPARPGAGARPPAARSSSSTSRPPASTSRAAPRSGRRSPRLAAEDGVTVFLTTQYLEEADALADRVGIIDHGNIVAEGTPAALKAEIGRPTVEAVPCDPDEREHTAGGPRPLRRARRRPHAKAPLCGSPAATPGWPRWSARSTPRASRSRPAAARALARRRLPGQDRPHARGRRGGRPRRPRTPLAETAGAA